jgi:hypothetical protein
LSDIEASIKQYAANRRIKLTLHAQTEMSNDDVSVSELLAVLHDCVMIENYPDHRRGECCLVCGKGCNRFLHVVCATSLPELLIITVYVPSPPKWETPYKRGQKP